MFIINTTRFSDIQINEKDVIIFPNGLIGFPKLKKYVLIDHEKGSPLKWLQSIDDTSVAFALINPLLFKSDYFVEIYEPEVSDLDIKDEKDAVISVITTVHKDQNKMTANLKAPLIFNINNRKGKQLILNNSHYSIEYDIIDNNLNNLRNIKDFKNRKFNQETIDKEHQITA